MVGKFVRVTVVQSDGLMYMININRVCLHGLVYSPMANRYLKVRAMGWEDNNFVVHVTALSANVIKFG